MLIKRLLILGLGIFALYGVFNGTVQAQPLTLVYTGNLDGELEPCGCSKEGDLGGIKRQATMIDKLRREVPNLILISSGGLLIADMPFDRIKSDYILKGMSLLKYDAIGVQWRDLAFGDVFLKNHNLPLVISNGTENKTFLSKKDVRRGDSNIVFFQWLDEPQTQMQMAAFVGHKQAAKKRLSENLQTDKQTGAVTILATTLPLKKAQEILPLSYVDILIIPARSEHYADPQQLTNTLLLQPGSRGMRLGRLDFDVDSNGEIKKWKHSVIPLPNTVTDAPRMQSWYDAYNAELAAEYERRTALRKSQETGQSPYAGADDCKACHGNEHTAWKASQHALAYESLLDANKVFDPNCVGCHSVGYDKPGGFLDKYITPHLKGVQCESCHGAARKHVDSKGVEPVAHYKWNKQEMCSQCHTKKNSPGFNLDEYWRKLAHGGKAE